MSMIFGRFIDCLPQWVDGLKWAGTGEPDPETLPCYQPDDKHWAITSRLEPGPAPNPSSDDLPGRELAPGKRPGIVRALTSIVNCRLVSDSVSCGHRVANTDEGSARNDQPQSLARTMGDPPRTKIRRSISIRLHEAQAFHQVRRGQRPPPSDSCGALDVRRQ